MNRRQKAGIDCDVCGYPLFVQDEEVVCMHCKKQKRPEGFK